MRNSLIITSKTIYMNYFKFANFKNLTFLLLLGILISCSEKTENNTETQNKGLSQPPNGNCKDEIATKINDIYKKQFNDDMVNIKSVDIPDFLVDGETKTDSITNGANISINKARVMIMSYYGYLMNLICQQDGAKVIDLIESNYSFDYKLLYDGLMKTNKKLKVPLNPKDITIRIMPALAENNGKFHMTLIISMEDQTQMILNEYPVIVRKGDIIDSITMEKVNNDVEQGTLVEDICPRDHPCPSKFNGLFSDESLISFKELVRQDFQKNFSTHNNSIK